MSMEGHTDTEEKQENAGCGHGESAWTGEEGNSDTSISGPLYPISLHHSSKPQFPGGTSPPAPNVTKHETDQYLVKAESH